VYLIFFSDENIIEEEHFLSERIKENYVNIQNYFSILQTMWEKRNNIYSDLKICFVTLETIKTNQNVEHYKTTSAEIGNLISRAKEHRNSDEFKNDFIRTVIRFSNSFRKFCFSRVYT
jgi:hypothetical protein